MKLQMIRLADDWGYQANCRQILSSPAPDTLKNLMEPYEKRIQKFLNASYNMNYKFPWNRLFEVEIEYN